MDEITVFVDSVEDIFPASSGKKLELTLLGLDIKSFAREVDLTLFLDNCKISEIKNYIKNRSNA